MVVESFERPVPQWLFEAQGEPTDLGRRFENSNLVTGLSELEGTGQASESGADNGGMRRHMKLFYIRTSEIGSFGWGLEGKEKSEDDYACTG